MYYDESNGEIFQHIEHIDRRAMSIISSLVLFLLSPQTTLPKSLTEGGNEKDGEEFERYMKETKNTICGRKPISVLLEAVRHSSTSFTLSFTDYSQSNHCRSHRDSSVSYASAILQPSSSSHVSPSSSSSSSVPE